MVKVWKYINDLKSYTQYFLVITQIFLFPSFLLSVWVFNSVDMYVRRPVGNCRWRSSSVLSPLPKIPQASIHFGSSNQDLPNHFVPLVDTSLDISKTTTELKCERWKQGKVSHHYSFSDVGSNLFSLKNTEKTANTVHFQSY